MRVERQEQLLGALQRLVSGRAALEDLEVWLQPVGTPADQRAEWSALLAPLNAQERQAFLATVLDLAPADRDTARTVRRLFKVLYDPDSADAVDWRARCIGTDLTFCLRAQPADLKRDRLVGIRSSQATSEAILVFETLGPVSSRALLARPSAAPMRFLRTAPQTEVDEHHRIAAQLPNERTELLNQAVAEAYDKLAAQRERLGLPPDPRKFQVLWRAMPFGTYAQFIRTLNFEQSEPHLWVGVNPDLPRLALRNTDELSPKALLVQSIAHELFHCAAIRGVSVARTDGLREVHTRQGQHLHSMAMVDFHRDTSSQASRLALLAGMFQELARPLELELEQARADRSRRIELGERGEWVTEYCIELGAILACDPQLEHFDAWSDTSYSVGVRQLAALVRLATPEWRDAAERAIVLAGQGSQRGELIQFAAHYLDPKALHYFRTHVEDALADPGLGGLIDAVASKNPQTRELVPLLGGPASGETLDSFWKRWDDRDTLRPRWVSQALRAVARDRCSDRFA